MDPLSLLAAAIAAGVVSQASSDGPDRGETVLRVRRVPQGSTTSPWPFVRGYSLETDDPADNDGLWHVTTALRSVLEQGVRSRAQTGAVGLGGGPSHQAPGLVSVTTQRYAALRIYRAMRLALAAAEGRAPVSEIAHEVLRQNDSAIQDVLAHEEFLREDGDLGEEEGLGYVLAERLGLPPGTDLLDRADVDLRDDGLRRELNERFPYGRDRYELLMKLEEDIVDALSVAEEGMEDPTPGNAPVGFTAPYDRFVQICPREVAIVQLAARRGARAEVIPAELELRFRPEDLTVVGWERPEWRIEGPEHDQVLEARRLALQAARRVRWQGGGTAPVPTAFLDSGLAGGLVSDGWGGIVFETTDPDVVVRVGWEGEGSQDMLEDEELQQTGGVVRVYGSVPVGNRVVSWRERVDPNVEWRLRRRYGDKVNLLLRALAGLYDLSSRSRRQQVLDVLRSYRATYRLYLAIRAGMPTSDVELSHNLGVTRDGNVVAFDL